MVDIIRQTSDITADWLTQALRSTGTIQSSVTKVEPQIIGEGVGLMAQLGRLSITYAEPESAPTTMIAKFAAANENKLVAQALDFYNRETNFYNNIGANCGLRVPASYFGKVDQASYDFVLLLEDLGEVSPNDQLIGASEEEAYAAIERIAIQHARYWQKVRTPANAWMYDHMGEASTSALQNALYLPSLAPALEKFESFFSNKTRRIAQAVGERYSEFWGGNITTQETFVHGDYRQDNMIYPPGSLDAIVMDWQISGVGRSIFDVTYFMCQSLQPALRKAIEKPLLQRYVARLKEGGVNTYDFAEVWHDYRVVMLGCLVYPITVCGSLDLSNARGRGLAECMLERNMAAIEELNCEEFV